MPASRCSSPPRYGAYLTAHRGIPYFRISVPNQLQSLLHRKELRRSLHGLTAREARQKATRLAQVALCFFALAEDYVQGRIQSVLCESFQSFNITEDMLLSVGTFWIETASQENVSPATLSLALPAFMKNKSASKDVVLPTVKMFEKTTPPAVTKPQEACAVPDAVPEQPGVDTVARVDIPQIVCAEAKPVEPSFISAPIKTLPSISKAVEAYILAKRLTWSPASAKDIPPQVRQFAEIIREIEGNRDISIDQLNREHIRRYYDTLQHLPHRIRGQKAYEHQPWLKLAEMGSSGVVERLLSTKTLEVRQTNVRSFINWCELEYRGAVQARYVNTGFPKVLSDKDIRRKGVKRESFTPEELQALFGDMGRYIRETEGVPSRFWSPLIALYSGMRLEEICQLHLTDIIQVDGVWCFSVNEENGGEGFTKHVKSTAGIRKVPIHPALWKDCGFKNFVESRWEQIPTVRHSTTLLFSDMQERLSVVNFATSKLGSSVTKWFIRYRRSVGVGGMAGEVSTKAFHSFRHTVIEYLHKTARVDLSMLQAVVGHELVDMGVTEAYAGDWPMQVLLDEVIGKLGWKLQC